MAEIPDQDGPLGQIRFLLRLELLSQETDCMLSLNVDLWVRYEGLTRCVLQGQTSHIQKRGEASESEYEKVKVD